MGDIQFNGTPEEWDALVKKNKKKETLEEAAEKYVKNFAESVKSARKIGFIDGAKWQQERMYSEEEVLKLLLNSEEYTSRFNGRTDLKHWFEQFKKK
jgi:ClpP class serine protease